MRTTSCWKRRGSQKSKVKIKKREKSRCGSSHMRRERGGADETEYLLPEFLYDDALLPEGHTGPACPAGPAVPFAVRDGECVQRDHAAGAGGRDRHRSFEVEPLCFSAGLRDQLFPAGRRKKEGNHHPHL